MATSLPILNLSEAKFECIYGRGCDGICCQNGRPGVYPEEVERTRRQPVQVPAGAAAGGRKLIESSGFLSKRRKGGLPMLRVVNGWCVFFHKGCVLHKVGAVEGDKYRYKPAPCALFPLAKNEAGEWYVRQWGVEGEEWDLFCLKPGDQPAAGGRVLARRGASRRTVHRARGGQVKAWKDGGERDRPSRTWENPSGANRPAERPLVQGADGGASLIPITTASEPFQLLGHLLLLLRGRFGEDHAGTSQKRIVAQQVQRHGRTCFQIPACRLQAEDLMAFQVDQRSAGSLTQRAQSCRSNWISLEPKVPRSSPGWHALDVVNVAEDARDHFRLVAASVADGIADQVDRPAFQLRRRGGRQRQGRR